MFYFLQPSSFLVKCSSVVILVVKWFPFFQCRILYKFTIHISSTLSYYIVICMFIVDLLEQYFISIKCSFGVERAYCRLP
jgi:hypothetical protein